MKKPAKTQVYFTVNGIQYYREFDGLIPEGPVEGFNCENLWLSLVFEEDGFKFSRDDGPAVVYNNDPAVYYNKNRILFRSSNKKDDFSDNLNFNCPYLNEWANNTNHILCKICTYFCNQNCFG